MLRRDGVVFMIIVGSKQAIWPPLYACNYFGFRLSYEAAAILHVYFRLYCNELLLVSLTPASYGQVHRVKGAFEAEGRQN